MRGCNLIGFSEGRKLFQKPVRATFHFAGCKAMKMLVTAGAIALVSAVAVMHAVGADGSDRPPGVSAAQWAPVSDSLGVVIVPTRFFSGGPTDAAPPSDSQAKPFMQHMDGSVLASPANGYFMVKRGGHWVRLVVIEPLKGPGDAG
jgi:hypothetical protein